MYENIDFCKHMKAEIYAHRWKQWYAPVPLSIIHCVWVSDPLLTLALTCTNVMFATFPSHCCSNLTNFHNIRVFSLSIFEYYIMCQYYCSAVIKGWDWTLDKARVYSVRQSVGRGMEKGGGRGGNCFELVCIIHAD